MALDGEGGADGGAGGEGGGFGGAADLFGSAPAGGEGGAADGGGDGGQGGSDGSEGGGAQGGPDPDWYAQLSGETGENETASNRDLVKGKGWKSLDDVVKGYREAERALRESGRVKIPGEGASAEDVAKFRSAIGVPETPEGYKLPEVKGSDGAVIPLDQGLIGKLVPDAHALGVPAPAFEGLVSKFVEHQVAEFAEFEDGIKQAAQAWATKQGQAASEKLSAIDTAGRALGLTGKGMIAVRKAFASELGVEAGTAKALDMFAKLGQGMAEDVMLTGGKGRFGITGREAQGELDSMKAKAATDKEFAKAVVTAGTAENARWKRLNEAAADWASKQPSL